MTTDRLREILSLWLMAASDDVRRAREDGDHAEIKLIEVERTLLLRIIILMDSNPDGA